MDNRLQGQVALITGASSGIGEATALALAAEGAKVALAARRVERLDALVQKIVESGGEALALACDVADEAQVRQAVQAVQEKWGRLDILVNNAGVTVIGPIVGADTEEWRKAINVNVLGLMYATHAALPVMKEQGNGHIINMSSLLSRIAPVGTSVYSATKWAVNGFSEALRQEAVGYKVRVTVIEPGGVTTEINNHIPDEATRVGMETVYNSMRVLDATDVAAAVLYAVTQPAHVSINELLVRPSEQSM